MDTLLITGSTGLTARKVLEQAADRYNVVLLGRTPPPGSVSRHRYLEADLTDAASVQRAVAEARPQAIIHTAAMTDVDRCEREPELAWAVNVDGTGHVAEAARTAGAHLVFVSTDYVFSGEAGPYSETDATDPRSVYGKSKLAAEQVVQERCPDAAIARTSTLYGNAPGARRNFVGWLLDQLQGGAELTVVTDQVSSPTLADNLAEMLLALSAARASGVYHTVGGEWLSRYELAYAVADCFGYDAAHIKAGRTADLRQDAPRPAHSGLVAEKIARDTGVRPLTLREGLLALRGQLAEARR